jgi:putative endonuclease
MNLLARITSWRKAMPLHLERGNLGEKAAKKYLQRLGLKFLIANYRSPRGEVDLVFRDNECLVFVEVKTRSSEDWTRPAAAVDQEKKRLLSLAAMDYLRLLKSPKIKMRFDIIEVLLTAGAVDQVRHIPNAFSLSKPYRYG